MKQPVRYQLSKSIGIKKPLNPQGGSNGYFLKQD